MRRPGDGKRARSESRCCPRVPFRRRRFYSKRLLLGAFASEAAKQLSVNVRYAIMLIDSYADNAQILRYMSNSSILYGVRYTSMPTLS